MILLSLGKSYTKTSPHASYPDTGNAELTDGSLATMDYTDAKWVGWQNTNVTICIDLGSQQQIGAARFHYGSEIAGGVYCPNQVVVSGSNNDVDYVTLGTFVKDTHWLTSYGAKWSGLLSLAGIYRYICFVFTYQIEWTFLSEIELYDSSFQIPVIDRSPSDIADKTPKSYMNFTDWDRIINNSLLSKKLLEDYLSISIPFDTIYRAQFVSLSNLNNLCHNIEKLRAIYNPLRLNSVRYSWGIDGAMPNYTHVNQWETVLKSIIDRFTLRHPRTSIAGAGRDLTRNNSFRG